MGIICKEKVWCVGGVNWDIQIFNATNCERRRPEATLGAGGGGGGGSELFSKMKVIVALISRPL